MPHISMPSINQFRQVIKNISNSARWIGYDDDGEPIFDRNVKLPTLKARGTIKIHGTCASFCYNDEKGLWFQSKNNVITPERDNAGFASFAKANEKYLLNIINNIKDKFNIDIVNNTITVFGEWAGQGIQKGVAVSNIPKTLFIFGLKVSPNEDEESAYWIDEDFDIPEHDRIFKIWDFKTYEIDIDFENPLMSQNEMVDMVTEVENECPVGKYFGHKGYGEGIVFIINHNENRHVFKMKGNLHAGKSKVKKAKKVDNEKLQLINDIVEKVTPEWRLSQIFNEVFNILNNGQADIKGMGDYIRAVINDIIKEDLDIINDAGLIPKDINKRVSDVARKWLIAKLDEEAGIK